MTGLASARRRPGKTLGVLSLALVGCGLVLAADPWKFPSASAESEAKKKYPSEYWYEQFPVAQRAVDREDRTKTEEIIARLRIAIALNPREDILNPTERKELPYYPYYYLAKAFVWAGDPASARACLDRELSRGKIQKSALEPRVAELRSGIDAELNKTNVLADAKKILTWESQGPVSLSPANKARIGKIKSLKETLEQGTADTKSTSESLSAEAIDLARDELGRRDKLVKKLSEPGWRGSLQNPPAPTVCQPSAAWRTSAADLTSAVAAVEACGKAVGDALRQAASAACREWKGQRETLKEQWDTYNRLPGPKKEAAPADLPASCSVAWETIPASDLEARFESLDQDRSRIESGLKTSLAQVQELLKGKEDARLQSVRDARNRLPEISQECARDLQIEDAAKAIASLRHQLEHPAGNLLEPDKLVQGPLDDLRAQVRIGVERIVNDKCPNLARGSIDELAKESAAFQQRVEGASLPCGPASKARSDVNQCWIANAEPLRKRLQVYEQLLTRGASQGGAVCFGPLTSTLRGLISGFSASGAWTVKAIASQDEAQKCLGSFSKDVGLHRTEVARLVPEIARLLEEIPADAPLPPDIVTQLGTMRSTFPGLKDLADKIAQIYGVPDGNAEALKKAIDSAGFDAGADVFAAIASLRDDWALGVLRDAIAHPRLEQIRRTVGEWDHVLRKLGPFQALSDAFSSFAQGDIDAAIARLREAEAKGSAAVAGKETARLHAALSYFLYHKRLAAGSAETASLLEKDARREADLARRADPSLQLKDALFRSLSFKKFYSGEDAQTANR